jgi:DNA-binding transcriptional regulator YdaS (Cro superfamily)
MRNALAEYLETSGTTQAEFARLVDVPPSLVSQWVHSERRPGLDNAFEIERATDGAVPARYWTSLPPVTPDRSEKADPRPDHPTT